MIRVPYSSNTRSISVDEINFGIKGYDVTLIKEGKNYCLELSDFYEISRIKNKASNATTSSAEPESQSQQSLKLVFSQKILPEKNFWDQFRTQLQKQSTAAINTQVKNLVKNRKLVTDNKDVSDLLEVIKNLLKLYNKELIILGLDKNKMSEGQKKILPEIKRLSQQHLNAIIISICKVNRAINQALGLSTGVEPIESDVILPKFDGTPTPKALAEYVTQQMITDFCLQPKPQIGTFR